MCCFCCCCCYQERAAGALANLAADDKCSLEVATAGGIHALVTLARSCKVEGVLEQVTHTLLLTNNTYLAFINASTSSIFVKYV